MKQDSHNLIDLIKRSGAVRKFTNKDGQLRLYDASVPSGAGGSSGSPYYCRVLFTQGDLTFSMQREKVEEVLNMDRGNYDFRASYSEGPDDLILEPFTLFLKVTTPRL